MSRLHLRLGSSIGAEAAAWRAAVLAAGGTVSFERLMIVQRFIAAEKIAGNWSLMDDYWPLWGEDAIQAQISLKGLRAITPVNSPTFTADRGYAGDGATSYLNTNFTPSTHFAAASVTNARLAVYEQGIDDSGFAMGCQNAAASGFRLRPDEGAVNQASVISASATLANSTLADGFMSASRNGSTWAAYKNGAFLANFSPSAGASLPTVALFICCFNNNGSPTQFRADQIRFACVGAALSAQQEATQYANIQAWATAIGANV